MEHFTPSTLEEKIGLSKSTLARYRCEGNGPAYIKVGRKILYPKQAVNDWMQENTYSSTSQYSPAHSAWLSAQA